MTGSSRVAALANEARQVRRFHQLLVQAPFDPPLSDRSPFEFCSGPYWLLSRYADLWQIAQRTKVDLRHRRFMRKSTKPAERSQEGWMLFRSVRDPGKPSPGPASLPKF
jgi:hypothetical protein